MKKIIFSLFLLCLMALSVSAAPTIPYILYGHVEWNSQMLSGSKLEVTNQNTGVIIQVVTDGEGFYVAYVDNVQSGTIIQVKILDGCGSADTCVKTVTASGANSDYAVMDFSITGALSCPPTQCPSCNCGGGGGSGCYINQVTAEKCATAFPCNTPEPSIIVCPPSPSNVCPEQIICPIVEEKVCTPEECAKDKSPLNGVLLSIITFLIGGGVVYIGFGTANKVKVKKVNGVDIVYHQHPIVSGYHSPDTIHKVNPHKKGELVPKYVKDAKGVWGYQI